VIVAICRLYGEALVTVSAIIVISAATDYFARMAEHSVLSALTAAAVDSAAALGWDRRTLIAEAGLDEYLLDDPDARIPIEQDIRLWEILSRKPMGLELGEELGFKGLGVVGYAIQHNATVGEALDWLLRFRAVVHPDVIPRMERRKEAAGERLVFIRNIPFPWARLREPVYASASSLLASMRTLSGVRLDARYVAYPLPRPVDSERHERYFSCPVSWGAEEFRVAFDASMLDLPLPRRDSHLFSYLARRVEELEKQLPAAANYAERVRREIVHLLAEGEPRLPQVAKRLALSERTLHRRLAAEGAGFAAIIDEARRERALLLLDDAELSCSEIAFLLGYSEPAVFFRAFRRWSGCSPQEYRKTQRTQREQRPQRVENEEK